ncbi:32254_t:CDS:2 [Gigaspora margarita]|uniref:32254_t:CDS:1 n=1 Tax=Gigaspora margarita TaxID=4874 RepID=A0ABN7UVL0_GIGMA|nr:32254_t:CDS:2 [Gigaspora margarita]
MIKKNNKRPLNKTEKFSEKNLAKCTLIKKTGKTRNSFAIITDDREDSITNNVLRSQSNNRRPLRSIQNESAMNMLNKDMNKISQQDIDNIWVSIKTGILYAAKQNIPFRKIPNSTKKALLTNKKMKSLLQKDTISITKSKIKAGKKAKWFSSIEDVLLQNSKNREIKEIYQTLSSNILVLLMPLIPILTDKRKKEWVLIDKENNELETKKIVRKYNRKIFTEHWSTKDNNTAPDYVEIEKSNGSLISKWRI